MTHNSKRELRLDLSTVVGVTGSDMTSMYSSASARHVLDLAFMRRIYLQAWPFGHRAQWNLGEWRHHLEATQSTAYTTACGFVEFHPDEGQSLFVELLAVDRRNRYRGHGRALMNQVIRHGLATHRRRVILVTTLDVEPFYHRLGFEFYREMPDEDPPTVA